MEPILFSSNLPNFKILPCPLPFSFLFLPYFSFISSLIRVSQPLAGFVSEAVGKMIGPKAARVTDGLENAIQTVRALPAKFRDVFTKE
jgi:hypothetical protein